jgi:RNA polymerase sigma-70 factor (ECF subfamily)
MESGESTEVHDREFVEGVLNGDKAAQRQFYDRHVDRVFSLALRMTGQELAARDCTQTTFIRLFDKLKTYRGDAALATWVHAVAVSVVLEWRRSFAREKARVVPIEMLDAIAAPAVPVTVIDEGVCRAIDALASRYKTVVVMHDIEGYTHDEIGAALGITAAASKVRLSRARRKLRVTLADYAGEFAYER